MKRQPWPTKRAKTLEQAVCLSAFLPAVKCISPGGPIEGSACLGSAASLHCTSTRCSILQSLNKQLPRCPPSSRRMPTSASQSP